MKFPYVEFLGLAEDRIFRPLVLITFQAGDKQFKSYALIDSGADYTILPIEIAGHLGLKLSSEFRYFMEAAGGSSLNIYRSPVEVKHIIQKSGFRNLEWLSYVYFAESGSTLLLGQKGFLDRFEVRLNGHSKEAQIIF